MAGRERAHKFMVVMSLTTVFLFSGTVFGWGAFSSMLQQEGYFDFLCEKPDPNHPCEAQLQALNNAFTMASTFVSLTAFVNGWLVDTLGPTKVTMIAGFMSTLGLLGIALTRELPWTRAEASGGGFDTFLWSTVLVAVGGSMTMFIGYQAPFLVPSHFTLLIEVNSCLFDAGTIIFPILKVLYDMGVPFAFFFWAYTVLSLVCFSLFTVAWAINQKELDEIRHAAGGAGDQVMPEHERPLEQRGMMAQMKSFEFAAIFIYSIIMVPRANMYMGSVELINRKIATMEGTTASLGWVSTITGFVIPFGFLAVPLMEMSLHRLGTIWTVQLTTFLGILYNALQLIPQLNMQLATVVVFAAWRAFLYSTISAFNGETFGVKTMGRIMGLCFVFSGLTNMATGPLVNSAVAADNFVPLLIEDLLVCLPLPLLFQFLRMKQRGAGTGARELLAPEHSTPKVTHGLDPMGAMSMSRANSVTDWAAFETGRNTQNADTSMAQF